MNARFHRIVRPGLLSILVLIGLAGFAGVGYAAWISLGAEEGDRVEVRLLESSDERIVLDYTLPGFYVEPVEIDGTTYYTLSLPGESNRLEAGLPELPHVCRSVIIPDQERMEVRIVETEFVEMEGYPVVPSKGNLPRTIDPNDVPYRFDPIYDTGRWYPADPIVEREPYILRDYRGLVVDVTPFQARGRDGLLRVARHMIVEVVAVGPDTRNTLDRAEPPSRIVSEFAQIYRDHFVNWQGSRFTPVEETGAMLVITYDAFHDAVVPLVEWKNQEGIPTTLVDVSTIGNNQTAIATLIEEMFLNDGLAFVLLVGDRAEVAPFMVGSDESDPSYSLLLGDDSYPELFVGRFSAENIMHAETQVQRTITYEKTPMAGGDWYHKGTGIASNQGPGDDGEYDNEHQDVIRQKLLGYGYSEVDQIYDPYGTAAQVTTALNEGRSTINYTGHGSETSWVSTGFSNSHVNALTNDWMLPFITSVACVNGDFGSLTCFAEAWLRATDNGNPTGAIAAYMSSINQSWSPPMCGQDAVIDQLVSDAKRTFGGLTYNGSCQMIDEYGTQGATEFKFWHIFGDPSVVVRTATPETMAVQHDGMILIGQETYSVQVPGIAGALCALYADGTLYGSAYTDAGGMATIVFDVPIEEPTSLTLTVTAYNKIPVIETVEVLPPDGPFLVFSECIVLDDLADGDGICDAGEVPGLELALQNIGVDAATGVVATLSTEDPYITVTVAEQAIEDILPDSIGTSLEPFVIEVDPNVPDAHVALFVADVIANEGSWQCSFNLPVQAPVLSAGACLIDDSAPGGDGDGGADADETFYLQLELLNSGHSDARELDAVLRCWNPAVRILDGEGVCLSAPASGSGILSAFEIELLPQIPSPSTVELQVTINGRDGFSAFLSYDLSIGAFFDDVEADRGWALGAGDDDATGGVWVRDDPVGTTYNGQPCQPEDDHTPAGTICFVTGNGSVGGSAGEADVDGGKTTLLSPVFDLSDALEAGIEYWRWYTNDLGNNPGEDFWDVEISSDGGGSWVSLEHTQQSANSWNSYAFNLVDYVELTDQVQIRFVASDEGGGSLVEAAVDDFTLTAVREPVTGAPGGGSISETYGLVSCEPNPFNPRTRIVYRIGSQTRVQLGVFDVAGRQVRSLVDRTVPAGEHAVLFDGLDDAGRSLASGVYFLRFDAREMLQVRQIALLK